MHSAPLLPVRRGVHSVSPSCEEGNEIFLPLACEEGNALCPPQALDGEEGEW